MNIAAVQQFWDRQPCNIRHATALVGTRAWSQQITERKYRVEPHIPPFAQFERWNGKRVLEIGCGIGTDTLSFYQHGAEIEACDISTKSVEYARQRCPAKIHCINAERWLPEGPFDLIYSFGVLHHTPHPMSVLHNALERLAPGGELRIMLYAKWSIKNLLGHQPEAQAGCPIARTYTERQARKLVEDAGFCVVSIGKDHIFPYRIPEYIRHEYVRHWYYRWMPAQLFHWLETKLGHHLLIVARKS